MNWQEKALNLYFDEHMSINATAEAVGKSRQSVSAFLKASDRFKAEKERRKAETAKKRKNRKYMWDKKNRSSTNADGIDAVYEGVKREHRMAAAELSRERFY